MDRIQRNFESMQRQVESWRQTQIIDAQAKLIFYSAFVEGNFYAPKSLLRPRHWAPSSRWLSGFGGR